MMVVARSDETIYENSGAGFAPGIRWLDMQNYRDPPPYPGHSKQVYPNQPGFRQSFSGSETSTDVSLSSTENLATSQRQEPQGEETQTSFNYHVDLGGSDGSSYSILERLGMPASALDPSGKFSSGSNSLNTSAANYYQDRSQPRYQSALNAASNSMGVSKSPSPLYSQGHLSVPQWQMGNVGPSQSEYSSHQQSDVAARIGEYNISSSRAVNESSFSSSSSASTLTMISREGAGNYSSYLSSTSRTGPGGGGGGSLSSTYQYLSPRVPPVSTYHHPHPYVNTHWTMGSGDSSSSSHSSIAPYTPSSSSSSQIFSQSGGSGSGTTSYSGHAQSLSYLTNLPPPPEYPGPKNSLSSSSSSEKGADIRNCRSYETMDKVDVQRSQSDLRLCASSPGIFMGDAKFQSPQRSANNSADDSDQATIAAKASQMVELLTEDNRALREELASTSLKVAKLQKFEMEIQKVHESHEAMVKSSQKRENLWLAMKRKFEEKIQSLEAQLVGEGGSSQSSGPSPDKEFRIKLAEKDAMISKLLSQNQELSASRDQLEGENAKLSLSVTEQRAHVDILENALLNAQSKVLALGEEYHKRQGLEQKIEQLQNALTALQSASDKQEKKEKEMRTRLEKELETYRAQEKGGAVKKKEPGKDDVKSTGMLRKMLDEKDARILQLETEMAGGKLLMKPNIIQWLEQKYVKETTLRQLSREDASPAPKEVRLAALEKSSSDMEKLIDEAKTEKLKHMEELHHSQRKVAELEAKVKQLQTQLVEKEAMVKVFQRSPLAMARSSSLHALCHSPLHSPRPSLIASHGRTGSSHGADSTSSGNYREFATIRHMKTGSASAIELGRKMSVEEDLLSKVQNLNTESKSDSEEEGKLFHV